MPSFSRYLHARLGPGSMLQCFGKMFPRAFGASDFTGFWRHWNPFVGYFLSYFYFAPLRRFAPRSLCLVGIAIIILASERFRFTLAHQTLRRRIAWHLLALIVPFAFSVGIFLVM